MKPIAVVRVRGRRNVKPKIRYTLKLLRLNRPNHAIIVQPTPSILGMLKVVKDYVTYGEIEKETLVELLKKRGEIGKKKAVEVLGEKEIEKIAEEIYSGKKRVGDYISPVFRLHPPRKGWKNIKRLYPYGALGERDNMDELLRRMM